jgi:mono/diheme cytochrome c family protein
MVLQGAEVLPEEAPVLIDYLAANLGPNSGSTSSKVTLPSGPGKEVVESRCSVCHAVDQAVSIRRTPEEWEKVINQMVEVGLEVTSEERRAVVSYLNTQFGKAAQ